MSNPAVDALVQQYFPNNPPPALSNVAFLIGASGAAQTGLPGGARSGIAYNMAKNYIQNLAQSGDIKGYYNNAANLLSTRYAVLAESNNDTSTVLNDLKELINGSQKAGINSYDLAESIDTTINNHITDYNTRQANRDTGGGFLDNLIGAIASPQGLATLGLAIATGGSSLALTVGEGIMGVGAAGAATVGAAALSSASSAVLASLTGGDVLKSAIGGAITGGVGANAADITSALGIDSASIANSAGLSKQQVDSIVSNALSSSIVQTGLNGQDLANVLKTNLSGSIIGAYASNIADSVVGKDFSSVSKVVGNVANIATKAAVNNQDIATTIQNNIPSIVGGLLSDSQKQDYSKKEIQNAQLSSPNPQDQETFNTLKQMFAQAEAGGNSIDAGTQYALLAQALPNFANDFMPSTPIVPVQAGQEGLQKFIGQAANDPDTLKRVLANPALKGSIDEYFNVYGGSSPQMDLNYLKQLLNLSEQDPTYQPYRDELNNLFEKESIQKLVDQNPDLYPAIDRVLQTNLVDAGTITVNVEAQRRTAPINDNDIQLYLTEGGTQEDIAKLIAKYGYQGANPNYAALPQPKPETPVTPDLPQPAPAVPSPTFPANDPVSPEPKVPGIPITPILPISPPGTAPEQLPISQPEPGLTPSPVTSPEPVSPSQSKKSQPQPQPVGKLEPAPKPSPQPQPKLEPARPYISPKDRYNIFVNPTASPTITSGPEITPIEEPPTAQPFGPETTTTDPSKKDTKKSDTSSTVSPTILSKVLSQPSAGPTTSSQLAAILGSTGSEPPQGDVGPIFGGYDKYRQVWNEESLKSALGI